MKITIDFPSEFDSRLGIEFPVQSTWLQIDGVMADPKERRIIVDGSELSPELNQKVIISRVNE